MDSNQLNSIFIAFQAQLLLATRARLRVTLPGEPVTLSVKGSRSPGAKLPVAVGVVRGGSDVSNAKRPYKPLRRPNRTRPIDG
jgi:hypothetical protein